MRKARRDEQVELLRKKRRRLKAMFDVSDDEHARKALHELIAGIDEQIRKLTG